MAEFKALVGDHADGRAGVRRLSAEPLGPVPHAALRLRRGPLRLDRDPREDRPARFRQLARNTEFFGAPVGLFFCLDRKLGPPQWADLGMFMQTFMLLAVAEGLATCAQEYWARYPRS